MDGRVFFSIFTAFDIVFDDLFLNLLNTRV